MFAIFCASIMLQNFKKWQDIYLKYISHKQRSAVRVNKSVFYREFHKVIQTP